MAYNITITGGDIVAILTAATAFVVALKGNSKADINTAHGKQLSNRVENLDAQVTNHDEQLTNVGKAAGEAVAAVNAAIGPVSDAISQLNATVAAIRGLSRQNIPITPLPGSTTVNVNEGGQ